MRFLAGATEQQLRNIAAEGLQDQYFTARGSRAAGLQAELTNIDYVEFGYQQPPSVGG